MRVFSIFLAACLVCGPVSASTVYECEISRRESRNVPPVIILAYDAEEETAAAFDPFIKYYVDKPIEARIVADNAKRLTIAYSLKDFRPKGGNTIVKDETRVTILKASGQASVTYSLGFGHNDTGYGTCKRKE